MAKPRAGGRTARNTIAYQGEPGANSDMACHAAFPYMTTLPCPTFETAMAAVQAGKAELAMIPVENSIAGRVADLHSLLPHTKLKIVAEHFQRVEHCLPYRLLHLRNATALQAVAQLRVDVITVNPMAALREECGSRQTDVAQADNGNVHAVFLLLRVAASFCICVAASYCVATR